MCGILNKYSNVFKMGKCVGYVIRIQIPSFDSIFKSQFLKSKKCTHVDLTEHSLKVDFGT